MENARYLIGGLVEDTNTNKLSRVATRNSAKARSNRVCLKWCSPPFGGVVTVFLLPWFALFPINFRMCFDKRISLGER